MISTGIDTVMDAAAKTGQLPLISVACNAYSPAASVYDAISLDYDAVVLSLHTDNCFT